MTDEAHANARAITPSLPEKRQRAQNSVGDAERKEPLAPNVARPTLRRVDLQPPRVDD